MDGRKYKAMNKKGDGFNKMQVVSKETISRLVRDIKENKNNPLTSNGIYYRHSDTDMMTGYALVIGPEDTPYHNGFYFFLFQYPIDYPYSPPTVLFNTNGNNVRFHPNFYRNGKVCVSMLNTWNGEQWSSCFSLNNILTTIMSMFLQPFPLSLEPLWCDQDIIQREKYNIVLQHANIAISICDYLNNSNHIFYNIFKDVCIPHFLEHYNELLSIVTASKKNVSIVHIPIYNMIYKLDYIHLFTYIKITHSNVNEFKCLI
jgi:ubiquitin-conjugating enzyme E2 Z